MNEQRQVAHSLLSIVLSQCCLGNLSQSAFCLPQVASALLNDIVLGNAGVGMILLKLQLLQSSLGW